MSIYESCIKQRGVSVVIPNWNGAELLSANLPYVLTECSGYAGDTELIVVDDCSTDNSVSILNKKFAHTIQTIRHGDNKGFSEACWTGVQAARHELILLLNTDVRPLPGLLTTLVRYFGNDDTFSVSPIIKSTEGIVQDVSFRIPFVKRGRIHYRKWDWEKVIPRLPRPLTTLWTSGGSMLVSRSKFIELGGFDHAFKPFYREDVDLGVRAWMHGWRCYVDSLSTVLHPVGKSVISSKVPKSTILAVRTKNSFVFDKRYSGGRTAWRAMLLRLSRELRRGRLNLGECMNVIGQVRRVGDCLVSDGEKTFSETIGLFDQYYGTSSPSVFKTINQIRHRKKKKTKANYHGVVEAVLTKKLNDAFADAVVVDLGCGGRKFPGALGVDVVEGEGVDIVHNLDEFPWPMHDDSCDMVIASHIVEHVGDLLRFLEECRRILRPDGTLVIRCPHFSCRGSFRHPFHLRHMCYDSIGLLLCKQSLINYDLSYGEVALNLASTTLAFRSGTRSQIGRFLANRNPKSYEQYWSRILPAHEICWVLKKPVYAQDIQGDV